MSYFIISTRRDDVTWDEELEQQARDAVSKNSQSLVDPDKVGVLERDAHSFWDKFYGIHQNKLVTCFFTKRILNNLISCSAYD